MSLVYCKKCTSLLNQNQNIKKQRYYFIPFLLTIDVSAHPVFGPHIFPSPIRLRATCESGAKSPLAPTVPFAGTYGTHPAKRKWIKKQIIKITPIQESKIEKIPPSIPGRYFSLRRVRLNEVHLKGGNRATRKESGLDFRRREVTY